MPTIPESTKSSLAYKLHARARERWPQLEDVTVTHRAGFAYVTGITTNGEELRLCRLRYGGSASRWGFAIYRASHGDYQPAALPDGLTAGRPEDALDTASGLYLGDPTAWVIPPKNEQREALAFGRLPQPAKCRRSDGGHEEGSRGE